MPLSLRKNTSSRGPVGLDLDGDFAAAVQMVDGRISSASSLDLPPGAVVDGEVTDVEAVTGVLKQLFRRGALPRSVRLGVANQQIVVRYIELPKIEEEADRAAAVRFQAADELPMPIDEAVLDYQVVGETVTPEGSTRMRVLVVAARESMIMKLVDAVRGAGLKPEGIDLNAFALVRALAQPSVSPDAAHVFCHLGGITNLAVAVGSVCLFTRPLAVPEAGDDASALADQIRLSLDYYAALPEARLVEGIVLSGPGSVREGLGEEVSMLTGLPVSIAEPLGALHSETLPADENPRRYTVAAGLALGATA